MNGEQVSRTVRSQVGSLPLANNVKNILLVIVIKDLSVGLQYNICTGQILSLELLLNTTKYFLLANAIA